MSNLKFPAVVALAIVGVLVSAGAVFGLRSWVAPSSDDVDLGRPTPTVTPTDVEPTDEPTEEPTATPTKKKPKPSATPSKSATPTPTPTKTKTPKPKPTTVTPTSLSTGYIESVIGQRLASTTNKPVSVGCPTTVSAKVGTSFSCAVRIQGSPPQNTSASVVIVGKKGEFKWSSGSAQ